MDQVPFWLHRPLKRFIQYGGVVLASLPFGALYVFLQNAVPPSTAFAVTFSMGLFAAYFAWRWLSRVISFAQKPKIFIYRPLVENAPLDDPSLAVAAGTLFVFMVVVGSQSPVITFPDHRCSEVGSTNVVIESANAAT